MENVNATRKEIFLNMKVYNELPTESFFSLERYTNALVNTIDSIITFNESKDFLYTFMNIKNELKNIYNDSINILGKQYPEINRSLHYSMAYTLLKITNSCNMEEQKNEEKKYLKLLLIEAEKETNEKIHRQEIQKEDQQKEIKRAYIGKVTYYMFKLFSLAFGKIYEVRVFKLLQNESLNPKWYNTNYNKYSANESIINLVDKNHYKVYDIVIDDSNIGIDVKVGTIFRREFCSSKDTNIFVSNEGFTEEKFRQYASYNKETNYKTFIAIICPELHKEKIYDKDGNEFCNNLLYQEYIDDKSIIFFLDVEEYLKTPINDRKIIPYGSKSITSDSAQICIPIRRWGKKPHYLYTFDEFKKKFLKNNYD